MNGLNIHIVVILEELSLLKQSWLTQASKMLSFSGKIYQTTLATHARRHRVMKKSLIYFAFFTL